MGPLPPTLEFAFLQHAQQHDLRLGGELADLVEEDGAAIGQLEAALPSLQRAGERALLVAEELGRDERRRDRGTIHGDERPGRARRSLVDRPGDELFAGAGLPGDQHGRFGRRDLRQVGEHGPERRRRADDLLEHRRAVDVFAQREIFVAHAIFGALAIVDVGFRCIPADDTAVGVANGVVADQEPTILPVVAARALLGFKRLTAHERLPAFLLKPRHITRMETADAGVISGYLFETEPCVVERELIRAESTSIWPQDGDGVWDGVYCLPQLFVCGGQFTGP